MLISAKYWTQKTLNIYKIFKTKMSKIVKMQTQSNWTIAGHKLNKMQHTCMISSYVEIPSASTANKLMGIVCAKILNFPLKTPITRSMWMRTLAIFLVSSSSLGYRCFFPKIKISNSW